MTPSVSLLQDVFMWVALRQMMYHQVDNSQTKVTNVPTLSRSAHCNPTAPKAMHLQYCRPPQWYTASKDGLLMTVCSVIHFLRLHHSPHCVSVFALLQFTL